MKFTPVVLAVAQVASAHYFFDTVVQDGPALYYMLKAPDGSVKDYDGLGDWFKIGETGVCTQSGDFTKDAWCTWDKSTLTATIPKDTPLGEYLLRFEHIGGGNGIPGFLVKFPGGYKYNNPYVSFSLYNGYKAFPMPGPAVWSGGSSDVNNTSVAEAVLSSLPSTTLITATRFATPSAKATAGCAKLRR
ncbi:hypothetical protein CCUS01_00727 [Colletotrichum cuscutae]|uniref:lytic cellulose monooxygenase (C4-dehydrogenating) n=1 Tax=Colletotrichum cuscutae TaxID=1209917 RepID=A0AAI9Y662_9PEZI|nr:hypothetical protein CCUS01_00727 [Colletotrichum cuscutae]